MGTRGCYQLTRNMPYDASNIRRHPARVNDSTATKGRWSGRGYRIEQLPVGPQLLWPSIKYGKGIERDAATHFPDAHAIRDRRDFITGGNGLNLRAFEEAVEGAEVHVFVLDHHFDKRAPIYWGALWC